jgi:hypothetical protein
MKDSHPLVVSVKLVATAMRVRVAGENQDESKPPLKRRRTRCRTLRKPLNGGVQ